MKRKKAYKYRFYPSDEQKRILAQTFGCCRYVYNWALRQRTDAYYQRGERLYYEGMAQHLVLLKKQEETAWLHDVSSVPLQQAIRHIREQCLHLEEPGSYAGKNGCPSSHHVAPPIA